ncbi:MAG: hypothetical protein FWC70_09105 [Defluviitaleaceae bacterium]|nr:hypothetical protein [Defluviitaleaceae bacterium]
MKFKTGLEKMESYLDEKKPNGKYMTTFSRHGFTYAKPIKLTDWIKLIDEQTKKKTEMYKSVNILTPLHPEDEIGTVDTSSPDSVYATPALPYNNSNGGEEYVDLQKYIDRLDQDRRESEKRVQDGMTTLKSELREDRQQMEQRIESSRQQMEQRMESRMQGIDERMEQLEQRTEQREQRMDKRFSESMARLDKVADESAAQFDKVMGEVSSYKRWVFGIGLTTMLSIAAMVVAVIIGLVALLSGLEVI